MLLTSGANCHVVSALRAVSGGIPLLYPPHPPHTGLARPDLTALSTCAHAMPTT